MLLQVLSLTWVPWPVEIFGDGLNFCSKPSRTAFSRCEQIWSDLETTSEEKRRRRREGADKSSKMESLDRHSASVGLVLNLD